MRKMKITYNFDCHCAWCNVAFERSATTFNENDAVFTAENQGYSRQISKRPANDATKIDGVLQNSQI